MSLFSFQYNRDDCTSPGGVKIKWNDLWKTMWHGLAYSKLCADVKRVMGMMVKSMLSGTTLPGLESQLSYLTAL